MNNYYLMRIVSVIAVLAFVFGTASALAGGSDPYSGEDPNKKVLKQGLVGAATGAISAEASGGKAGKGALVGAGTSVIGGALLDTLTTPSQPAPAPGYAQPGYAQPGYAQPAYPQQQAGYYGDPQPQPVYPQPYYPPRQDPTKKVLKQGLLGAATGAISAEASGGKAGTGALVGAGTSVIGGALLDSLTEPSQPAPPPAYYPPQQPQPYYQPQPQQQPQKRIIRKYDAEGNIISEEEIYE